MNIFADFRRDREYRFLDKIYHGEKIDYEDLFDIEYLATARYVKYYIYPANPPRISAKLTSWGKSYYIEQKLRRLMQKNLFYRIPIKFYFFCRDALSCW